MRTFLPALSGASLMIASGPAVPQAHPPGPSAVAQHKGDDFAFQIGAWRVKHRVKTASSGAKWQEFDGTSVVRAILGGRGNVEDNVFFKREGISRGVALRTYDAASRQWAIWWVDGRNPHGVLDPPMKGRFEAGVGTFYSDSQLNGKPVRTRFIWSRIKKKSARWEQAYSFDEGATWDTNWIMEFRRAADMPNRSPKGSI